MSCKSAAMQDRGGIILIDKPGGWTSHDVVDFIRNNFDYKKVGHAGTLDPMATGLLIILLGKYTKQSAHFLNTDKEYQATLCLGATTDTGDQDGAFVKRNDLESFRDKLDNIEEVFKGFIGKSLQTPPMYSAKKINGKKLYEFARKGITVKREKKEVYINRLDILHKTLPYVEIYLNCSKGTYVRQLACDIGEEIGCGAYLTSLRRTKIGSFSIDGAITPEDIKSGKADFYENILQP